MTGPRAVLIVLLALIAPASGLARSDVRVEGGMISGTAENGVRIFKGIPYAAPPVGALRWRSPRRVADWAGVRSAKAFGPACPQPERRRRFSRLPGQAEDCLTLNIWAPKTAPGPAPVMVWIHGGAFRFGAGSLAIYDGTVLAREGVVLVTINYRLGHLGFFAHPALRDQQRAEQGGNYGILDQIAALEWVRRNIAAFGGDPGNVTIFGESAGGVSVNYLMTIPATKDLFHKAISESGGGHQCASHISKPRCGKVSVEKEGIAWARKMGLDDDDQNAAALRALPADRIIATEGMPKRMGFGPFVDGRLIVDDIGRRFAEGRQHKVPYMAGANSHEASLMTVFHMGFSAIRSYLGADLGAARKLYGIDDDRRFGWTIFRDGLFLAPARDLVGNMAKASTPGWMYYFGYVPAARRAKVPGAVHGAEILYVMGNLSKLSLVGRRPDRSQERVSAMIRGYWLRFAATGNPNGAPSSPPWPAFDRNGGAVMVFGNDANAARGPFMKARLDFHQRRHERRSEVAR